MSKSTSGRKKARETGRTASRAVEEQPWDHDWQNYDPERDPGDKTLDSVLRRRKKRKLAHERNISFHEADMLIRYNDVEVADAEVVD
jgi:hypothetical protein